MSDCGEAKSSDTLGEIAGLFGLVALVSYLIPGALVIPVMLTIQLAKEGGWDAARIPFCLWSAALIFIVLLVRRSIRKRKAWLKSRDEWWENFHKDFPPDCSKTN